MKHEKCVARRDPKSATDALFTQRSRPCVSVTQIGLRDQVEPTEQDTVQVCVLEQALFYGVIVR